MPTVDLSILANKASLTGSEQIILNDGGSAKDVTVDVLASRVLSTATSLTVTAASAYPVDVSMAGGADRGVRLSMSADGHATFLNFQRSKGTPNSPTAVAPGQQMGRISYSGHDGSVYLPSVEIRAEVDGAVSGGSVPGRLLVSTRAAGAENYSERVRVTSDGDVGIGTTSPTSRLHVVQPANSNGAIKVACQSSVAGAFANVNFETSSTYFSAGMEGNGRFFIYNAAAAADQLVLGGGVNSYVSLTALGSAAVVLRTAGSERFRVDPVGNVGVGTTAPTARLHVWSNANQDVASFNQGGAAHATAVINHGDVFGTNPAFRPILSFRRAGVTSLNISIDGTVPGVAYYDALTSTGAHAFYVNNTERVRIDAFGNLLVTSSAGGAIGYGTGSGGTVAQLTSKTTAVTLNRPSGRITTNAAALAAGAVAVFTLNNTAIAGDDCVAVSVKSGNATPGTYQVWTEGAQIGSCLVCLRNITAGSLSEAVAISFAVVRGATA